MGGGMRLFRFSAVLMLLLVAVNGAAQTVSGSMSGVIVDGTGQVLPGADVAIIHENSGEERRTVTNEIGAFVFPSLAPGPYTIRVTLTGFKPLEVKANIVQGNNRLINVGNVNLGGHEATNFAKLGGDRGQLVLALFQSLQ